MTDKKEPMPLFGISHGFATWDHFSRALLFALLFFAILFGGMYFLGVTFIDRGFTKIEYSKEGGLLLGVEGHQSQISYLPASELWMDSGYEVLAGDTVNIWSNGRVHLALDRLVEGAVEDDYPKYAWTGPDGKEAAERYIGDTIRDPYLIAETEPYGRLLMSAVQSKNIRPSKFNPRPQDGIIVVGSSHQFTNNLSNPVRLYFTVNDLFIDAGAERAYLLDENKAIQRLKDSHHYHKELNDKSIAEYLEKRKITWEKIANNRQYWDIWFTDNLGGYNITIVPSN